VAFLLALAALVAVLVAEGPGHAEGAGGMIGFAAMAALYLAVMAALLFTGPARRRRTVEKRRFRSNEEFVHALGQNARVPADIAIAVRCAFARAYDLPIDSVWVDEHRHLGLDPGPGRIHPLLHEFAIYLAEALPSAHDPMVLGDRMARRKVRANMHDLLEAASDALA